MPLKRSAKPPARFEEGDVQEAVNRFNRQVLEALEHFTAPLWLATHSSLAAPYFLADHIAQLPGTQSDLLRGQILQILLLEAAQSLAEQREDQRIMSERLRAQAERNGGQHRQFYVEHLKQCIAAGDESQQLLYWSFFEPIRPTEAIADKLGVSRATYFRRINKEKKLDQAIEQLGIQLAKQVTPTLRLESPPNRSQQLFGRDDMILSCLKSLRDQQTVALIGAGGIGKTALGAQLVAQFDSQPTFWFTVRPGLNDNLGSLLFGLSYFLYRQGMGVAWLQLIADEGEINTDVVQSLIFSALKQLPNVSLLCFDEIDLLRPGEVAAHDQICAFVMRLRAEHVPLLLIGQRLPAQLTADVIQPLSALEPSDLHELLKQSAVYLTEPDIERLQSYTRGNPRLLELFVSLYRSGESLEQALERMASNPSLDVLLLHIVEKLQPNEQQLLRQLAVFRRPAPADAWSDPGDQAVLDQLVTLNLMQHDAHGGIAVLPAFRATLYNQPTPEQREALHLQAALIRADRGEYTAAAHHYFNSGQPRMSVWSWYLHRDEEKKGGQAEAALAILREISANQLEEEDRSVLLVARSELEQLVGHYDQIPPSLMNTASDDLFAALIERMRGNVATLQDEFDQAISAYRAGLGTVERLIGERALFRKNLSWVAMRQKNLQEAWREACLARYEAENIQGYIQMELSNYAAAQHYYEGALMLAKDAQYIHGIAKTCDNLGRLLAIRGLFAQSYELSIEAKQLFEQIGDKVNAMGVVINQAMAHNLAHEPREALALAREALAWFEQIGETWGQAAAAQNLAEAYLALDDLKQATQLAERVLQLEEQGTLPDGLRVMGEIKLAQGALAEAERDIRKSITLAEENQDRYLAAYGWRALAGLYNAQRSHPKVQEAADKAVALFAELELFHEVERTRGFLDRGAAV